MSGSKQGLSGQMSEATYPEPKPPRLVIDLRPILAQAARGRCQRCGWTGTVDAATMRDGCPGCGITRPAAKDTD